MKADYYFKKYEEFYNHSFGRKIFKQACWKEFLKTSESDMSDQEVCERLREIATEKVNNSKSKWYIYG